LKSKIASGFGLVALHEKQYHHAALKFIECQIELGATYNEVGLSFDSSFSSCAVGHAE
jgi:hypothetical protein